MNIGKRDNSISPSRSRSHSQHEAVSLSSQDDVSNKSSKTPSDVETTGGPDSESGYADPIDALRKYYESQTLSPSDVSSLDAPYQSVAHVQRLKQAQMNKAVSYDEDPTYSRPFDCLIGLPTPLKVRAETTTRKNISPLALQRQSTPDFPVSLAQRPVKRRGHHHRFSRKLPQRNESQSSSDDDGLSSSLSPSPEPDYSPLINNRQSSASFDLLGDDDPAILLADEPTKILKSRVSSDGDLLSMNSVETQSPLNSPEPFPILVPSPVEITKMQNGYAKVVYPDMFISH